MNINKLFISSLFGFGLLASTTLCSSATTLQRTEGIQHAIKQSINCDTETKATRDNIAAEIKEIQQQLQALQFSKKPFTAAATHAAIGAVIGAANAILLTIADKISAGTIKDHVFRNSLQYSGLPLLSLSTLKGSIAGALLGAASNLGDLPPLSLEETAALTMLYDVAFLGLKGYAETNYENLSSATFWGITTLVGEICYILGTRWNKNKNKASLEATVAKLEQQLTQLATQEAGI